MMWNSQDQAVLRAAPVFCGVPAWQSAQAAEALGARARLHADGARGQKGVRVKQLQRVKVVQLLVIREVWPTCVVPAVLLPASVPS